MRIKWQKNVLLLLALSSPPAAAVVSVDGSGSDGRPKRILAGGFVCVQHGEERKEERLRVAFEL